ncbi:ankyrin [Choiromyces venosus 120613-1]|uniref:Ankyrin n=1 Tax=Choiromyces venosus 120613-1 TaxID=1336337 RepID=A0A3N4JJ79_9PEZI|nr:ankyrin [Choiromyces venosus 120613-1]
MPFTHLPNELVYRVAEFLPPQDINSLRQTNQRFAALLSVGIVNITCQQKDRDWCMKLVTFYAGKGNVHIVRRILERAAETIKYEIDPTVLEGFVRSEKDENLFLTLHAAGAKINGKYGPFEERPIHWAVEQGRLKILRVILDDAEADVNCMTSYGYPPLVLAITSRQEEAVRMLLTDPRVTGTMGGIRKEGALHLAAAEGNVNVVRMLLEDSRYKNFRGMDDNGSPLLHAVKRGRTEVVQLLLEDDRPDLGNFASENGLGLLHESAKRGYVNIVKIFLDHGRVDVNQQDIWGSTAFGLSFFYRKADVLTLLLKDPRVEVHAHDPDVDYREEPNVGESLLHHAARDGDCSVKLTIALLEDSQRRFNVNQLDSQGRTPLHLAAYNGGLNLLKVLVWGSGVNINVVDARGQTALHVACKTGNSYAVRILLTHPDMDVNAGRHSDGRPLLAQRLTWEVRAAIEDFFEMRRRGLDPRTLI